MRSNILIDKLGYLYVKDFAKIARMSIQGVHKAFEPKRKKTKRIENFIRVGSIYLIHRSELKKFIKKGYSSKQSRQAFKK